MAAFLRSSFSRTRLSFQPGSRCPTDRTATPIYSSRTNRVARGLHTSAGSLKSAALGKQKVNCPHSEPSRRGLGVRLSSRSRLHRLIMTSSLGRRSVLQESSEIEGETELSGEEGKGEESVMAAIALITGTTVGAGILALPATASPAGFLPSSCVLLACWGFLTLQAFLLVEVNVSMAETAALSAESGPVPEVLSLRTMAETTLGPVGGGAATAVYLFLSYTLMVAYISKGSQILEVATHLPPPVTATSFCLGIGGLLYRGSARSVDALNQILTAGLLGMFAVIVVGGSTLADWDELARCDWQSIPHVIPIVFLSLVYHDLVPVVCSSLGQDRAKIRTSLLVGSLIPVAMLLSWDAVALCMCHVAGGGPQDPLQMLMQTGGPVLTSVLAAFSLLAVSTSFIGSVVGLTAFASEQISLIPTSTDRSFPETSHPLPLHPIPAQTVDRLSIPSNPEIPSPSLWGEEVDGDSGVAVMSRKDSGNGYTEEGAGGRRKAASYLSVLLPPLACALSSPDAFFWATEVAGAYGMTALYGLLPPLMAWSLRRSQLPGKNQRHLHVPGGNLALAGLELCAVAIIATQALSDSSKLSSNPNSSFEKSELVMVSDFQPPSSNFQEGDAILSM